MPETAVQLLDVHKSYRLRKSPLARCGDEWFEALRGISLSVAKGERLGIVGRNGAGKTTLLKLITGNVAPTRGTVIVNGEVQALMQVGLGFHPEFNGRENARSALLYNGLAGKALETAVNDVLEFSELGEFIDQPVSTYSLGMRMRLQFATATAIKPEILIVDEVMGAGDAYFSAKSADRMKRLTASGCTLLLVSHSPYQVFEFCDEAIWLDRGAIRMQGAAHEVLGAYEVHLEQLAARSGDEQQRPDGNGPPLQGHLDDGRAVYRWPGKSGLKVSTVRLTDGEAEVNSACPGGPLRVEMVLRAERAATYSCRYLVTLWSERMRRVARVEGMEDGFHMEEGEFRRVEADLGPLLLNRGEYYVSISLYDTAGGQESRDETRFDVLARCLTLRIAGDDTSRLPLYNHPARWEFAP